MHIHPSFRPASLCLLVAAGCTAPVPDDDWREDEPLDDVSAAFVTGKADAGCGAGLPDDAVAHGMLQLVNDAQLSAATLDLAFPAGVGLPKRVAHALAAARPFATLADLDAVPHVGPRACASIVRAACDLRGLCEPVIDVVTWNIENFPLSETTSAEVRSTLGSQLPEIVAFQEVRDAAAFEAMFAEMPDYTALRAEPAFDTGVALAFRGDRLRLLTTEDLFVDDRYAFPRPVLRATFELRGRAGSTLVTVVVVHLKAQVDERSENRRRVALQKLDAWTDVHRAATTEHVILLGDFNDGISDGPADDVFAPFRDGTYTLLTQGLSDAGAYSYVPFRRLIDHIVVTDAAASVLPVETVEAMALDTVIDGYTDRVSDHRPVRSRHRPVLPAVDHVPGGP